MRFRPGLAMSAFVLFFLPLTLALGMWQLNRADEKNQLLTAFESRTTGVPVDWIQQPPPPAGTAAKTCLEWSGDTWYLDNRTVQGRAGYEVYLPMRQCVTGTPVLLRLGWIEGLRERTSLPAVDGLEVIRGENQVRGEIRPRLGTPWLSAEPERFSDGRWRIQSLTDIPDDTWGEGAPVMQLEEPDAPRLQDAWDPVSMPPERHVGYAIQWFGLATVLVLGFLIWGYKRGQQTAKRS